MKEWIVEVPIVGRMEIFVEAENEEEAIQNALSYENVTDEQVVETAVTTECRGTVCHLLKGISVELNE